jgi:hypothetical protein
MGSGRKAPSFRRSRALGRRAGMKVAPGVPARLSTGEWSQTAAPGRPDPTFRHRGGPRTIRPGKEVASDIDSSSRC